MNVDAMLVAQVFLNLILSATTIIANIFIILLYLLYKEFVKCRIMELANEEE